MKHIFFLLSLALIGCGAERDFPEVKKLSEYKQTNFVITPQSPLPKGKNAVYSVPMIYTWQQIQKIGAGQVVIDKAYTDLTLLNDSKSWEKALNKDEYTASTTVEEDNRIIARAEFSKSLPFLIKLIDHGEELKFKGEAVPAFGANYSEYYKFELYKTIKIVYYKNDDEFAIRLIPKDTEHEVLLYMPNEKGTNLQQMFDDLTQKTASAIKEIQTGDAAWKYSLEMQSDELLIPKFSFNIETNYNSLEGSEFKMGDKPYLIEEAYQRTAFLLDEEGAKAESVAEETVVTEEAIEPVEKPHPKKLHFNKPFLVILKRKGSPNPYFAMWVENTELMQK